MQALKSSQSNPLHYFFFVFYVTFSVNEHSCVLRAPIDSQNCLTVIKMSTAAMKEIMLWID